MKKIKEVSKIAGVSRRTLQYYDDAGILSTERTENNHRVYHSCELEKIWQILIYKEMAFELSEIKKLLQLSEEQKKKYLIRQREKIQRQMINLKVQMRVIAFVQVNGFPPKPDKNCGKTYVKSMEELRECMKKEVLKEEKDIEQKEYFLP